MFAPRIAQARTRPAEKPGTNRASQQSKPLERRLDFGTAEEAQLLQRTIGNHARTGLLARDAGNSAPNQPSGQPSRPGPSWDFSRIPVFPPGHRDRPQQGLPFTAAPFGVIQRKLEIGAVNDPLEAEADRVAEQVMRMPEPARSEGVSLSVGTSRVQGKCSCDGSCDKCKAEESDDQHGRVQLKPAGLTRSSHTSAPMVAPPIVHEVLRSPGQPLDPATRALFESRFGRDFSAVRVHADARAVQSARAVNARAYTVGSQIAFAAGQYQTTTLEGAELVAHELAHVVQQNSGGLPSKRHRTGEQIAESPGGPVPPVGLLQRSAKFVAGREPEDQNLAEQVIAMDTTAADAIPLLNGQPFLPTGNIKVKNDILEKKILDLMDTPNMTMNQLPGKGGVECWVDRAGVNEGSYIKHLPTKPPWNKDTTVGKLKAALDHFGVAVPADCSSQNVDASSTFTVEGDPSSAKLNEGIKAHEQHHAEDDEAAFNDTFVPWDKSITAVLASKGKAADKFQGKDQGECVSKIFQRVGFPQVIAAKFLKEIVAKADAFHSSHPQIAASSHKAARAGPSCAQSWLKMKLP